MAAQIKTLPTTAPAAAPRKAERGLNDCNFIGRLGADPELTRTSTGLPVATARLAVQSYPNAPAPDWIKIRLWRGAAETFAQYTRKGSRVHITGKLRTGSYTDRDGVRRTSAVIDVEEFLFLGDPGHHATVNVNDDDLAALEALLRGEVDTLADAA